MYLIVGPEICEKKHCGNGLLPNSFFLFLFVVIVCNFDATTITTCAQKRRNHFSQKG
jgi:hypothetical protein